MSTRILLLPTALLSVAGLAGCGGSEELTLGTAADVDFGTVTVTDVREGSSDELESAGFSLDPEEKAASVYYVDVTFANTGDAAVAPGRPSGEDPDENLISALTVIDLGGPPFTLCPAIPEEIPAGEEVEACTILLVPAGVELDRITYLPPGGDEFVYWETS